MNTELTYQYSQTETTLMDLAEKAVITNGLEANQATSFIRDIKDQIERIGAFFKLDIENAHKTHKSLCEKRNFYIKPLEQAEITLKNKLSRFQWLEQERVAKERAVEEAKAKAEAKKVREEMLQKAAETTSPVKQEVHLTQAEFSKPAPVQVAPVMQTRGTTFRMEWDVKVLNKAAVPEEYKTVDEQLLRRVAKLHKGQIQIPGIEIIEVPDVTVRR